MGLRIGYPVTIIGILFGLLLQAAPQSVRWTGEQDSNADLSHILDVIKQKTGIELNSTDFFLLEDKPLATTQFTMLQQSVGKTPIRGQSIRIWKSRSTGEVVQVEANIDKQPTHKKTAQIRGTSGISNQDTVQILHKQIQGTDDPFLRDLNWTDSIFNNELVRIAKIRGKHGHHQIVISMATRKVIEHSYQPFSQAETSIKANIFPIYEEVDGTGQILGRVPTDLRYIQTQVTKVTQDPFAELRNNRYIDDNYDPILGLTAAGRNQGLWTMAYIKTQAAQILSKIAPSENTFNSGLILSGRFATINLHPDAAKKFKGLEFKPAISPVFRPTWVSIPWKEGHEEMVPLASLLGKPIKTADEAWNRPARRLPDHDAASYINDGFDELQVYYAINQMFESLIKMGFQDPELSTRKFNAFLYDPDITYKDNAYYTDDTINFTTYSAKHPNFARDNTTIWHELGHGVMDRLMGDYLTLADTGGLSEGMADFVAQMVLNDITEGKAFPGKENMRILNNTGFLLTNEVHDDGEAYGGTMNDILMAAMKKFGAKSGLAKMTDLTLETMRLTRNHPALTANDWFDHMLFADSLGSQKFRQRGELKGLILAALAGRNFNLDGSPVAEFSLKNGTEEVVGKKTPGTREAPILVELKEKETASYNLKLKLTNSKGYQFKFPVTVRVQYTGGPLQGSLNWEGKAAGFVNYTLPTEDDTVAIPLTIHGKCDAVNRPDGTCSDYAYIQIWNAGETQKPQAKKRFYLRLKMKS